MTTDIEKLVCLHTELETSVKLIKAGFGALQEIDISNDFYHLPHQLLASGLERLMKCYIALVYKARYGAYPDMSQMKMLGHDLDKLFAELCTNYYGGRSRPLVLEEFEFVTTNPLVKDCIRILSLFGKFGRYYNLDVVAGSPHDPVDPRQEWEALEACIEDPTPYLMDTEALYHEYYPRVHSRLVGMMERIARAIAFQFTIGDHVDPSGDLGRMSVVVSDFRTIKNDDFGMTDYRQSVRMQQQRRHAWIRREEDEILGGAWPARVMNRTDFDGNWPFRADRIVLECQHKLFCVVYIEGFAFALNGAAADQFNFPTPHEAGLAILGKSIGPFIDMARSLTSGPP